MANIGADELCSVQFALLLCLYAHGRRADVVNQNTLQCQIDASYYLRYYTARGRSQIARVPIHHHVATWCSFCPLCLCYFYLGALYYKPEGRGFDTR
jgi:hypothetical protein